MLVLQRLKNEDCVITHTHSGDRMVLRVVDVRIDSTGQRKVRLGFAGDEFEINRAEVQADIDLEKQESKS